MHTSVVAVAEPMPLGTHTRTTATLESKLLGISRQGEEARRITGLEES